MSNPESQDPQTVEKELSPEARVLLGKARRSFGISIGILLLGFMAIGFALVYRVMRDAPPPAVAESVVLPAGAEVVSAVLSDGALNITYSVGGATVLAVFDQVSGELEREVPIKAE